MNLLALSQSCLLHLSPTWNLRQTGRGGAALSGWSSQLTYAGYRSSSFSSPTSALSIVVYRRSAIIHVGYYLMLRGYREWHLPSLPSARAPAHLLRQRLSPSSGAPDSHCPWGLCYRGQRLRMADPAFRGPPPASVRADHGSIITCYTLWDKQAVSVFMIPPLLLDWSTNVTRCILIAPYALRHWDEVRKEWNNHRREVLGVAALNPLSYIFVLTALVFTPVSYVAPAREISILIGTLFGAKLLSEGDARRRMLAAGGMVAGVIALALG